MKNMDMDISEEVRIIIDLLGKINEEIDPDILEDIIEEIDIIDNEEDLYEIAIISIKLGKPDILKFILNECDLTKVQLNFLKELITIHGNKYKNSEITEIFDSVLNTYLKPKSKTKPKSKNNY